MLSPFRHQRRLHGPARWETAAGEVLQAGEYDGDQLVSWNGEPVIDYLEDWIATGKINDPIEIQRLRGRGVSPVMVDYSQWPFRNSQARGFNEAFMPDKSLDDRVTQLEQIVATQSDMQVHFAYRRRSTILAQPAGLAIALSPNLRRDKVSFNGTLRQPLHFREAISALHDVVISDLTYKPKDDTAYQAYKKQEQERENAIRRMAHQTARKEIEAKRAEPIPPGLEAEYRRCRKVYWDARQAYSNYIAWRDPELWRLLMPCDPVVTVAPDVLLFECFSADESSYGCLSVNRDAFNTEQDVALGTTNVDYSWALYEHFQQLRSYRETRFLLDPTGFEVQTQESAEHREEKIPLPPGWLRGFMAAKAGIVEQPGQANATKILLRESRKSVWSTPSCAESTAKSQVVTSEKLSARVGLLTLFRQLVFTFRNPLLAKLFRFDEDW